MPSAQSSSHAHVRGQMPNTTAWIQVDRVEPPMWGRRNAGSASADVMEFQQEMHNLQHATPATWKPETGAHSATRTCAGVYTVSGLLLKDDVIIYNHKWTTSEFRGPKERPLTPAI
jgi:hypothetical protein